MIIPAASRLDSIHEYYFSKKLEQIRQMNEKVNEKMNEKNSAVINLGIGSPDLPPSQSTIDAAVAAIANPRSHGYASYRGTPELRQAIASWYKRIYDVEARPDKEVLPLLGSKEGLFYISMAFLNPGDKVLVPNPGYPAYASVSRLAGADVVYYDLQEDQKWQPDFAKLSQMDLKKVKLMWVNYPHMPTGQAGSADLFCKLIDFGVRHQILICHDNPYGMVLNKENPLSLLTFDKDKKYSLELNSFSKAFNMAGWRVGMVIGNEAVIETILKVKSNVDSGTFLPIQNGAVQALQNPPEWHQKRNAVYQERREWVYKIFDRLGFQFTRDQVGLFVWAKAPTSVKSVETYMDQILEECAVFLTPGFIFGTGGERYARCSLCATSEQLQQALERLERLK
jgi:LL-diaminopimelate aminotransferase